MPDHFQGARQAVPVAKADFGGAVRIDPFELGVEGGLPLFGERALDRGPHLGIAGGRPGEAEGEMFEVIGGAARHDRDAAAGRDLTRETVGGAHEIADRELLVRVGDVQQVVREARAQDGVRFGRAHVEPAVNLFRVGVDDFEFVRERLGEEIGFPRRGRPEEQNDGEITLRACTQFSFRGSA